MRKLIRSVLKGVSFTAALFVFQACYGTPQGGYQPEDDDYVLTETIDEDALEAEETPVYDLSE